MDLSELARVPVPPARLPAAECVDAHRLVAQIGSEVAGALTAALERVTTLASTGRIDRAGLRALRDEVELARRIGIMGQQVSRLAGGRVQMTRERLNLAGLLRETLRLRGREIDARGTEIRQMLASAEVMSDATLLFSLLQAVLDWSFEHARSRIDLSIDIRKAPACARLACQFHHRPSDELGSAAAPLDAEAVATLDTMSWRLLHQTALVLGLDVQRNDTPGRTELTLEFPDTLPPQLPGPGEPPFDDAASPAIDSRPLAGRHVLLIAARRDLRRLVRDALGPLAMMVDYVTSVDEAVAFCAAALPHAIVYDGTLAGARFEQLRQESLQAVPGLAFVELAADGRGFETFNVGGRQYACVGRDDIPGALPGALSYELTRLAGIGQ